MDRQRSGVGSGLRQIVSCVLFSAEREHSLPDAQDRSAHVLKQIAKKKTAQTLCASRRLYSRRGIKTREPQHELLGQGQESS